MKKNIVPIVAAAHDLSGFGRSSLSVVIPILSAMQVQVCALPTSVLSAHGIFAGHTFVDLTHSLPEYIRHWESLDIHFDCFYSGFLGSPEQVDIMEDVITTFGMKDALVVIDPVFADHGKLYSAFDQSMVEKMRSYIANAHIITPNITEAAFLLDMPLRAVMTPDEVRSWLRALCNMGPDMAVITSVHLEDGRRGVAAYDARQDRYFSVFTEYIPADYFGTGDIFTSVMTGSLLSGDSLPIAIDRAAQFVSLAIRTTFGYDLPKKDGVLIERILHTLYDRPSSYHYEIF
jgi:pyridoxine kinase